MSQTLLSDVPKLEVGVDGMVPGVACRHRRAREPESIQCSCRSCETDLLVINCASHVDVTPLPSSKTIVFPVSATTVGTEVGQVANILTCFITLVPLCHRHDFRLEKLSQE